MEQMSIEMPKVKRCEVGECGYNLGNNCHAKAITIGDYSNPGCDTFLDSSEHTQERNRIAGVGACKVINCQHNSDYECQADNITVGYVEDSINCQTYSPRI